MGYSVRFDGDGDPDLFGLASTHGLTLFGDWVSSLPAGGFAALKAFALRGSVKGTDALAAQLSAALRDHPPTDEAVAHTAQGLLELTGVGDPGETAAVVGDDG